MSVLDRPSVAGRREWIGLGVLALPCLLYSMDLTVLNLAVPHLSADLEPSGTQLLWIVDIYGFLVAGSLITMGTLGDRIGRRRLLLTGAVGFGAASMLAAFSFTAPMLIAARAILGVASATLAPSTLSLIRNMFLDPRERTVAVGVWIASFSAGGALGPLLGGLLLEHFWWGSVFLVNVPVMLLLLALGPRLLPEYRDPNPGRLDPISAALSLVAVLAVIYGIKQTAEGEQVVVPVAAMVLGSAIGIVFVRRQRTLADPLIDLSLFRSPAFTASLLVNVLGFFVAFGTFLFIAQYLQLVLGMSPLQAGLWTAPSGLAFIAGSMLAPVLARGMPPTRVIACGFAVAAAGFAVLTQIGRSHGPRSLCLPTSSCHWGWRPCSQWPPTSLSAWRRLSGLGWRRRFPKRAPNSAVRWASPSWAASSLPSIDWRGNAVKEPVSWSQENDACRTTTKSARSLKPGRSQSARATARLSSRIIRPIS
jgi:MFS transporter, DHA2 family, multidrug resistance protein